MPEDKIISIAIAAYNGEKYIKEQLTSILSQIDIDDEVIISDDGSTDKTIEIIKNRMENVVELLVPLKVSIEYGKNWGEFH